MRTIAFESEKMDSSDLFDNKCREIENGYHVKIYSQCGCLWGDIVSAATNCTTFFATSYLQSECRKSKGCALKVEKSLHTCRSNGWI